MFSPLYDWTVDAAASPPIEFSAARFKAQDDDFAEALNDLPTRSQIVQFISDYNTDPTTLNEGDFTVDGSGVWKVVKTVNSVKVWVNITSGDPIDLSAYALNSHDLAAVEGISGTGLATRTATDTWTTRSITKSGNGLAVTNGDGVSGNPTIAIADDLAALEALSGTDTLYYRSGDGAWSAVTVGSGLSFSGGTLFNSSPDTGTPPSLANQATQELASSQTTYVSPGTQKYHPLHPKAWGNFTASGGTPTLGASSGISSVTNISTGIYEVTLSTAMSSTGYAVISTPTRSDTGSNVTCFTYSKSTTTFRIRIINTTDGSGNASTGADFVVFGDL